MSSDSSNWSAYWKTRDIDSSLEGAGVEHHTIIHQHWDGIFVNCDRSVRLIDLACGAGTVIKRADKAGLSTLTALDYAPEALRILNNRLPHVTVHQASLLSHGLPLRSFDRVVSQFGVEYAGNEGFAAAAELLAPGGHLHLLCHLSDGGIHEEVSADLVLSRRIKEVRFIERAKSFAEKEYRSHNFDPNTDRFQHMRTTSEALAELAHQNPEHLAAHLLNGFQQLMERRFSYDLQDILGWLDGMENELNSYIGRMEAMLGAALDENKLLAARQALEGRGLRIVSARQFPSEAEAECFAWSIDAVRP